MIPTNEPQQWPWYIRLMFIIMGIIITPLILFAAFVEYLQDEKDVKEPINNGIKSKETNNE